MELVVLLCERINNFFCSLMLVFDFFIVDDVFGIFVDVFEVLVDLFVIVWEVDIVLWLIKLRKVGGFDGILNIILKIFLFEFVLVIVDIYNILLCEGYFLFLFKLVVVFFIFKERLLRVIESDLRFILLIC